MRLFFATDIHGSDVCWRKFLNSGQHYEADVIVLGGDMTGKALIPVVDDGNDSWYSSLLENRETSTARTRSASSRRPSGAAATTRSGPRPTSCASSRATTSGRRSYSTS